MTDCVHVPVALKCRKKVDFPSPVTYDRNSQIVGKRFCRESSSVDRKVVRYFPRVCSEIFERIYEFRPPSLSLLLPLTHKSIDYISLSLSAASRRCPRRINVGVDRNKIATYGINVRAIANNAKKVHEAKVTCGGYLSRCARKELLKFCRRTDISRPLFPARIGSVRRILPAPVIGVSNFPARINFELHNNNANGVAR